MVGDKELLNFLIENIDMGINALEALIKNLEKTDNKIRSNVLKAMEEYRSFQKKCNKLRKVFKAEPKKGNLFANLMTKLGTDMEFKKDNSDSKIAETLIQGYNMGILDITQKIKAYEDDVSEEILNLTTEYKTMMETGIKDIEKYL